LNILRLSLGAVERYAKMVQIESGVLGDGPDAILSDDRVVMLTKDTHKVAVLKTRVK
jgi:hypothetical protein